MKKKTVKPPSAQQMRKFSKKFTRAQWNICCEVPSFVQLVDKDLAKAELMAVRILQGEHDEFDSELEEDEA